MSKATNALELAVVEQLSALGGYCGSVDELFAELKCRASQQNSICRRLRQSGVVDFREDIVRFGLTVTGKTLLKLDTSVWPVTPDELLVLRSCSRGRIGPQQIHPRVPTDQRQTLLKQLAHKKLIVVYETAIVGIELTQSN
jgi:hypothetical protein